MVVLICISLMISDAEHLFMYLLTIWVSSLKKKSVQICCPAFDWIVFCYWVIWIFKNTFDIKSLSDIWLGNIFLPSYVLLFPIVIFLTVWVFCLIQSHLFIFAFSASAFGIMSKKLLAAKQGDFFLYFLLGLLWFQVFNPFQIDFCDIKICIQFHSSACDCPVSPPFPYCIFFTSLS